MNPPHNLNLEIITSLFSVESHSYHCERMQKWLDEYLSQFGDEITYRFDDVGNIYVTKGKADTYPCVISHIDTVHAISKSGQLKVVFYDDDTIFGVNSNTLKNSGIGGDDKCGIFACLYALDKLDAVKLAFFVDEEVGCKGSEAADMEFFKDCRYVLQADRRGNSDFVNNIGGSLSSKDFQDAVLPIITNHGYKFSWGMMSDVQAIRDNGSGLSCANMSAAYYNPHSDNEYVVLSELENVCEMIVEICSQLTDVYPHIVEKSYGRYGGYNWADDYEWEGYGGYGHSRFPSSPALGYGTSSHHIGRMSAEDKKWYEENIGMEELEEEPGVFIEEESDLEYRERQRMQAKLDADIAAYFPADPPVVTK